MVIKMKKIAIIFATLAASFYIYIGIVLGVEKTVTISWDANIENDLSGYKIYYGTSSGNYNNVIDVGNTTLFYVSSLVGGKTYFFVVTAYDFSNNESEFSEETSIYNKSEFEGFGVKVSQNFPNPFNLITTIVFDASEATENVEIIIKMCNINGKSIKNLSVSVVQGHRISRQINLSGISAGVYFCEIIANGRCIGVMKMLLIK